MSTAASRSPPPAKRARRLLRGRQASSSSSNSSLPSTTSANPLGRRLRHCNSVEEVLPHRLCATIQAQDTDRLNSHAPFRTYGEEGQSLQEFCQDRPKLLRSYCPTPRRSIIYLQPIIDERQPTELEQLDLDFVSRFLEAFLPTMKVRVMEPWRIEVPAKATKTKAHYETTLKVGHGGEYSVAARRSRDGPSLHPQIGLNDLADALLYKVPRDAWCRVGVSMLDLYEDDNDDFCMGRAWGASRVAVLGFFRYAAELGKGRPPRGVPALREAMVKTLTHEILHCFLFDHCTRGSCLMNTTGNLHEDFEAPLWLCEECLAKLCLTLDFDVRDRYACLAEALTGEPAFAGDLQHLLARRDAARRSSPSMSQPAT
ncbi:uncharacterized protein MONBRDRAFT_32153 [Monosiga brevicollis MX1]|uniref:Uncharacterized protein n=1 Tax=Monosiga brevicollis TaxID=81824 RepID=A9UXZ6_MONBE|nr:uncharacterized protein MONBRDRAFT_32153 [Monosiga brevicollis MX1]EDQ89772.1 predicted protein [Monosiga brevicollis MX1]|eukprot:XP_001745194.1 hypothetical protein [Monosiga brevicollis MX1]